MGAAQVRAPGHTQDSGPRASCHCQVLPALGHVLTPQTWGSCLPVQRAQPHLWGPGQCAVASDAGIWLRVRGCRALREPGRALGTNSIWGWGIAASAGSSGPGETLLAKDRMIGYIVYVEPFGA